MKPFQKALLAGFSALALTSVAHSQETLGTINLVQVNAQIQTLPDAPTEITSLGGQITDRLTAITQRVNSRTIIEAFAASEGSGFPASTPIAGWNLVEIFDETGAAQGLFIYKPGFAPLPVSEEFFSVTFPEDSFQTFVTVVDKSGITSKDNHYLTSDVTGTLLSADNAFTGTFNSTSSIHNVGPRLDPLTHTSVLRKGTIRGNTATYSITGSVTSIGNPALVSIQKFVDAAGTAPVGATAKK